MKSMFIANDNRAQLAGQDTQEMSMSLKEWRDKNPGEWGGLMTKLGAQGTHQLVRSRILNEEKNAKIQGLPEQFQRMADPYAKERDQVIRDPGAALNDSPFFKFMQEKYLNATQAKNAAGGFRNSGRGLMALGEASQKASADYLFPYLQSLGRPGQGASAYLEGYKISNPVGMGGGGGGGMARSAPRASLSSMGGMGNPSALPYTAQPAVPSYSVPESQYGFGMGPLGPLAGYGPSSGAGTGAWMNNETLEGGYFGG